MRWPRYQEGGPADSVFGDALPASASGFSPPLISGPPQPWGGEADVPPLWSPPSGRMWSDLSTALHGAAEATGAYRDPNRGWGQTLFEAANIGSLAMPAEGGRPGGVISTRFPEAVGAT